MNSRNIKRDLVINTLILFRTEINYHVHREKISVAWQLWRFVFQEVARDLVNAGLSRYGGKTNVTVN